MSNPRWKQNGAAYLSRQGFTALIGSGASEHELSRLLREKGGDEKWATAMVAELDHLRCRICGRSTSPAIMRTYADVRKATGGMAELAAALQEMVEAGRPAREAVENASSMSNDERRAAIISWLARDQGVPEAAMRVAVFNVRSQAVVVEHSHETNGNGNGNGVTP